jgi:hypothetical protein
VAGVGAFLREHPEQIRAVARSLQAAERLLESRVGGDCMGRQLPDGARIRIQLARRPHWQRGEIVAYLNGERVTVHRVLFCGRSGHRRGIVITRGDERVFPDLPFEVSAVLGSVVAVETPQGWTAPAALPRRPLVRRLAGGVLFAFVALLAAIDLSLARRCLAALYLTGSALVRPLRPARAWLTRTAPAADAPRSADTRSRSRAS